MRIPFRSGSSTRGMQLQVEHAGRAPFVMSKDSLDVPDQFAGDKHLTCFHGWRDLTISHHTAWALNKDHLSVFPPREISCGPSERIHAYNYTVLDGMDLGSFLCIQVNALVHMMLADDPEGARMVSTWQTRTPRRKVNSVDRGKNERQRQRAFPHEISITRQCACG